MNKEANAYEFPFEINAVKKLKCSGASEARIEPHDCNSEARSTEEGVAQVNWHMTRES